MTISSEEMQRRYARAQELLLGMHSKSVARNTTLAPHWIGETSAFWYVREFKDGHEFRLVDAETRRNETAFDHNTFAEALCKASGQSADARNLPISSLSYSLEPLQVEFDAFDARWRFEARTETCSQIESYSDDWVISPNGKWAAFTRRFNLWVKDLETGTERPLTRDGEPHYQYAALSSAWGMRNSGPADMLWSPDSKRILTLQEDKRSVKSAPTVEFAPRDGSVRSRLTGEIRIAHPADEHIDEYRFLAIDVETGRHIPAQYARVSVFRNGQGYFKWDHGWWSEDSRHAYFIDIVRGGDHTAKFVEFDTQTGKCRILIEEESPETFFKLRLESRTPIHPRPLRGSDDMLWFSERTGWGHLYLYDMKTGALKNPVTQGNWVVRDVHHWDAERRELIIQTAGRIPGRDAYYRDICRVNVDTGELTPIIESDDDYLVFDCDNEMGMNYAASRDVRDAKGVSPSGVYLVATRSRIDTVPLSLLLDRDGNELLTVEEADVSDLPDGWRWPESVKLKSADGKTDIYGTVFRPSHFSKDASYPILEVHYPAREGCAYLAGSFTNNSIAGAHFFNSAALSELGFIVVSIYGRGTMLRSRDFSKEPHILLPTSANQADRIAGMRQLAERYPYMDIERVGSGGLQSSSAAVSGILGHPDFYKVAVSNAAVIDYRSAPAFFSEPYGDFPNTLEDYTPIYDYVDNLKGKLLITHGMMAPYGGIASSFQLIDALQRANKDFDMLILPNDGYGMGSGYATRRTWDYLVTHLLGAQPPKEFALITPMELWARKFVEQSQKAMGRSEGE